MPHKLEPNSLPHLNAVDSHKAFERAIVFYMTDELRELQEWYDSQCDGDWEHSYGIRVATLDNPGWSVQIELEGTDLEGREFAEVSNLAPEREWIHCRIAEGRFMGDGGAPKLGKILRTFLNWSRGEHAEFDRQRSNDR